MYLQVKNDDVMMMMTMIDNTNINNTHQLLNESCALEQNKTSPVCKTYPKPDHLPPGHPSCPSPNHSRLSPDDGNHLLTSLSASSPASTTANASHNSYTDLFRV